ncbi:MAG: prolipoprotein diacylglyceryl transferase [Burkholderiaceae bacterium]|nr:MAG: prolipoprotein diacylglyceryl transferase [Burkholderiaceae bacterium]
MLVHPNFDPIAFSIGPVAVRWYGLMYVVAFLSFLALGRHRIRSGLANFTLQQLDDLLFYGVFGVVLGGRLGYILFYKPTYYLQHPLEALMVWHGGMSFHGGFLGVLLVLFLFARKAGKSFLEVTDFVAPLVPLGLAAGRMGNFINGELWGRATTLPWGMVFPQAQDGIARHPSQLYQFALEGLLLFVVLWWFSKRPRPIGQTSALFLIGYGVARFIAEFAREPDEFLGLLFAHLSMGQWLSLPMIVAGLILFNHCKKQT